LFLRVVRTSLARARTCRRPERSCWRSAAGAACRRVRAVGVPRQPVRLRRWPSQRGAGGSRSGPVPRWSAPSGAHVVCRRPDRSGWLAQPSRWPWRQPTGFVFMPTRLPRRQPRRRPVDDELFVDPLTAIPRFAAGLLGETWHTGPVGVATRPPGRLPSWLPGSWCSPVARPRAHVPRPHASDCPCADLDRRCPAWRVSDRPPDPYGMTMTWTIDESRGRIRSGPRVKRTGMCPLVDGTDSSRAVWRIPRRHQTTYPPDVNGGRLPTRHV